MKLGVTICTSVLCAFVVHAEFHPGRLWRDTDGFVINAHGCGVTEHEGVYYWYGEHKVYGKAGNRAHVGVHVYSSTNLCDWVDRGIALSVSDDSASPIYDGCIIERPKVIYCPKTGKFVMFFHLELQNLLAMGKGYYAAFVGVATAECPEGPFTLLHAGPPNSDEWRWNGHQSRDMTLFVDDDGTAWHFYSSELNKTMHVDRLTDDYCGYTGESHRILIDDSTEAPAVFKCQGKYWLIGSGCTGWKPNCARLYSADKVTGPWVRHGNPCTGTNPQNGLGPEKTWGAQSTYVLQLAGGRFIAMFDIWRPNNHLDSRYVWLPVEMQDGLPTIAWRDTWKLEDLKEIR